LTFIHAGRPPFLIVRLSLLIRTALDLDIAFRTQNVCRSYEAPKSQMVAPAARSAYKVGSHSAAYCPQEPHGNRYDSNVAVSNRRTSMAKKSFAQKTQRTIVGAVKSRRVQRIALKAAIAAATTAATAAAAAAVMKSAGGRKGQTQKTAAISRTKTGRTGRRKRR
jgi:hypothetical protein